eukprot:NODE_12924_length_1196_cov_2.202993.p10 GENE.NODE_12924_length_1196_cov_2.202993~~NODE_12924_length_1196_cov_2.202993.p10  ORF type:complete len:59 (+),score=4.48 NODE_12924_length_1196_cov_2.202993:296-472(+)
MTYSMPSPDGLILGIAATAPSNQAMPEPDHEHPVASGGDKPRMCITTTAHMRRRLLYH